MVVDCACGCGVVVVQGVDYLLLISEVEETEIFKICLEYWQHLACTLYNDSGPTASASAGAITGATQLLGGITNLNLGQSASMRRSLYKQALSKVRLLFSSLSTLRSTVSINSLLTCTLSAF